jgi:hypothetical protein
MPKQKPAWRTPYIKGDARSAFFLVLSNSDIRISASPSWHKPRSPLHHIRTLPWIEAAVRPA